MIRDALKVAARRVNLVLRAAGVELVPLGRHDWTDQEAFIPFEPTLKAAAAAGLPVGDYIDTVMSKTPGATQATIDGMARAGVFERKGGVVLEIGPGSGRYLDKAMKMCAPSRYEIYETAKPWAEHLVRTYGVIWQPTSGFALDSTPTASVDIVHAHKVFNSINFMATCCLWTEMARVTAPGGFCVFDIMSEPCLIDGEIARWAASGIRAGSFPTAVPRAPTIEFFQTSGFDLVDSFLGALGQGKTEVLIFRKRSPVASA